MLKKLFLSLTLALFSVGTLPPAPAQAADILSLSGTGVIADFSIEDECGATFVTVFAEARRNTLGYLFIEFFQFDDCAGTGIWGVGEKTLDPSEFSIDQGLNSASLNTSIEVFDEFTGTVFTTLDVHLNWTGTGDLNPEGASSFRSISPSCKQVVTFRDKSRTGEASGVISDGTTNYAPEPATRALLYDGRFRLMTIGCDEPAGFFRTSPGADANFYVEDECGATFARVIAEAPPNTLGYLFIEFFQFDDCAGTEIFGAGEKTLDPSEFSIDKKLTSASLNTSIEVFEFGNETPVTTLDIHLNWTGTGDLTPGLWSSTSTWCKGLLTIQYKTRTGEASGVISDGTTNYAPEPAARALLYDGHLVGGCP